MGRPLDAERLGHGLAELADDAPLAPVAGRAAAVRRRATVVRRRRAAVAGVTLVVAGALVAPLPGLLRTPAPAALAGPAPERSVATFAFPDAAAVAELVELPADAQAGRTARLVVRVRSERGRVGGVDLTFGDGQAVFLEGRARCTPGAAPVVLELPAEHAWTEPGRYTVRAAPQVVTGCRDGLLQYSVRGTVPGSAVVEVR